MAADRCLHPLHDANGACVACGLVARSPYEQLLRFFRTEVGIPGSDTHVMRVNPEWWHEVVRDPDYIKHHLYKTHFEGFEIWVGHELQPGEIVFLDEEARERIRESWRQAAIEAAVRE